MTATPHPPARHSIGLAAAAHLEVGLLAMQSGQLPAAVGALAAIDDASWEAIVRRFPALHDLLREGVIRDEHR